MEDFVTSGALLFIDRSCGHAILFSLNFEIMTLNENGKHIEIFDGAAQILHTGTKFGCVHPKDPNFQQRFDNLRGLTEQESLLAPVLAFNTRVTPIENKGGVVSTDTEGFYRTPEETDGVVVSLTGDTLMKIAVMRMDADCGLVTLLAPNGEMAVLHGAFQCVDNADGSSIVTNAISYFASKGIDPKELRFRVGEAAQHCCFGYNPADGVARDKVVERADRLTGAYGLDVVRSIKNPPRDVNHGIGFDVPLIAARQADKAGVRDIEVEGLCISCHGLAGAAMGNLDNFGTWFSNLREKPETWKARGYGMRNSVTVY